MENNKCRAKHSFVAFPNKSTPFWKDVTKSSTYSDNNSKLNFKCFEHFRKSLLTKVLMI